jgi:recombination protein RecR
MAALTQGMESLVAEFAKLPGVGRKTAFRLALHLLTKGKDKALALSLALQVAVDSTRFCDRCGNLCEEELCLICQNPARDAQVICVVEQLQDLLAIERAGEFRGHYHVLGGVLSPLDGVGPDQLRLDSLAKRVSEGTGEVILATNSTVEGDATALYIQRLLKASSWHLSRLARGLPMGGQLDYVDQLTLARALEGREKVI